jgi:hypothetical protein
MPSELFHFLDRDQMRDGTNHAANLGSVGMYDAASNLAKPECLNRALLSFKTFYRGAYLCNFQLTHFCKPLSVHRRIRGRRCRRSNGDYLTELQFLLLGAQLTEPVKSRFHDIERITAAEHFAKDILNTK